MKPAISITIFYFIFSYLTALSASAAPHKESYLELARMGWVFEYNSSIRRRDASLPEIKIDSRSIATGAVCILGDEPHPLARGVISSFDALLALIFDRDSPMRFAGADVESCGDIHQTYIRLYSRFPPQRAFDRDLATLDRYYGIGFPGGRSHAIRSPAQASTYFGREGVIAHLLVKQPPELELNGLERDFHKSILIEELFQVFSFGLDVLIFDRETPFQSKLQEYPLNLRGYRWDAPEFMNGILNSNPSGLCAFDIFMLHALAKTELDTTNTPAFLDEISNGFDALVALAAETLARPEFEALLDPDCSSFD